MRWIIILSLALVLCACHTSNPIYYHLPDLSSASDFRNTDDGSTRAMWVQQIAIADYLAGNGIVYQTSEVTYAVASQHLWASPLNQQLQQTLVKTLSQALPERLVSVTPVSENYDTLSMTITGFHGRSDGNAIISGQWILQQKDRLIGQSFNVAIPLHEEGYDALVSALGNGWREQARQIAQAAKLSSLRQPKEMVLAH